MVTKAKRGSSGDRIAKRLGRVIELPGGLVVLRRKKLEEVLEDLYDAQAILESRKEKKYSLSTVERELKKHGQL